MKPLRRLLGRLLRSRPSRPNTGEGPDAKENVDQRPLALYLEDRRERRPKAEDGYREPRPMRAR